MAVLTFPADTARRLLERAIGLTSKPTLETADVDDLMLLADPHEVDGQLVYTAAGLNEAAATAWDWKANLTSDQYDLGGGPGRTLDRSQWHQFCLGRAAAYRSGAARVAGGGTATAGARGIGSIGVASSLAGPGVIS